LEALLDAVEEFCPQEEWKKRELIRKNNKCKNFLLKNLFLGNKKYIGNMNFKYYLSEILHRKVLF